VPTEKPRVTITMTEQELNLINDYRFQHKIKNQTQAILSLVEKGFEALQSDLPYNIAPPPSAGDLTSSEAVHIKKYRALDDEGRGRVDNVLDYEYGKAAEDNKKAKAG
jgi:hypothetical protein